MTHAFVIGGSGMLRDACLGLARSYKAVSVVARKSERLFELKKTNPAIAPIAVDYSCSNKLLVEIERSITVHGKISLVVCWVHDSAPKIPWLVAEKLNSYDTPVQFYHILGSAYSRPNEGALELKNSFLKFTNITYFQIILGFVLEQNSSRWLTNEEISSGVLRSIESGNSDSVVGAVEPWSMRP